MFGIRWLLYSDCHCIVIPTALSKTFFNAKTQQDSSFKLGSGARDPRSSLNRARVLNPSSDQLIKNPSSAQQIKNLQNAYDIDCQTLGLSQVKNLLQMGRIIQNIYSGDLKSGLVWILNGLKEVGLEIV